MNARMNESMSLMKIIVPYAKTWRCSRRAVGSRPFPFHRLLHIFARESIRWSIHWSTGPFVGPYIGPLVLSL